LFVFGKLFSGSAAEAISICRRRKRTFREETANPLKFPFDFGLRQGFFGHSFSLSYVECWELGEEKVLCRALLFAGELAAFPPRRGWLDRLWMARVTIVAQFIFKSRK
jgi:hypothetical protein